MAAREALSFSGVESIDLVDLDPAVTNLFTDNALLANLNSNALSDPRVQVINGDALSFLEESTALYDVIIIDLPDPSDIQLGKLYSKAFYDLVQRRLGPQGESVGIQATSPYRARKAFWTIVHTVEASSTGNPENPKTLQVNPYHTMVPSFGTWGFILGSRYPVDVNALKVKARGSFPQ